MDKMHLSTELFEMALPEKGREEGLKEGIEKGMETTLLANIKCLVETMQLTAEQAMHALRVPARAVS